MSEIIFFFLISNLATNREGKCGVQRIIIYIRKLCFTNDMTLILTLANDMNHKNVFRPRRAYDTLVIPPQMLTYSDTTSLGISIILAEVIAFENRPI